MSRDVRVRRKCKDCFSPALLRLPPADTHSPSHAETAEVDTLVEVVGATLNLSEQDCLLLGQSRRRWALRVRVVV